MSPHQDRYRLLLDEMLPKRDKFPILNKLHNLRHIVHDFKGSGLSDEKVVAMPEEEIDRKIVSALSKWVSNKSILKISHSPRK